MSEFWRRVCSAALCACAVLMMCAGGEAFAEGTCGDGKVQGAEACDDGNAQYHDGCVACKAEEGWSCPKTGGACTPVCGDKIIVSNEDCDAARQRFHFTSGAPPSRCPFGGTKAEEWFDDNGNGVMDAAEVTHVSYLCDPSSRAAEPEPKEPEPHE